MFLRNWYLFTPLLIVIIPGLAIAYYMGSYGYAYEDAKEALQYVLQSSTRYPPGYSDEGFSRVRPGMDDRKVFNLIGTPFERHNDDTEWLYSLPKGIAPYYHERLVIFTHDKLGDLHVKKVVKGFHTPE